MEAKQVIVFRKDLLKGEHGIRKGRLAGQVAHASLGALLKCFDIYESTDGGVIYHAECRKGTALDSWLNGIFTKVVVGVDSLQELMALTARLEAFLQLPAWALDRHGMRRLIWLPGI